MNLKGILWRLSIPIWFLVVLIVTSFQLIIFFPIWVITGKSLSNIQILENVIFGWLDKIEGKE